MSATAKSSLASCSVLKATKSHECDGENHLLNFIASKRHDCDSEKLQALIFSGVEKLRIPYIFGLR
jgi:hypothetical protein